MKITRKSVVGLLLVLGLSAVLDIVVALNASITTDEGHHVSYGMLILHFKPDRVRNGDYYDSQMPVSALNAAPLAIAAQFEQRGLLPPFSQQTNLVVARSVTILASLALALMVYLWALDLYGEAAALASCLLCALSPNLVAHGTLATNDMYHALGVVGSLFFFRRFLLVPTVRRAFIGAFALALAQITKPFAILLYAVVLLAIAGVMFSRRRKPPLSLRSVFVFAALAAVCFLAVLNVAFCFDRTFKPLSYSMRQMSDDLKIRTIAWQRAQQLPIVGHLPVPVPYPFLEGIAMMRHDEGVGQTFGNIYLLGKLRDTTNRSVRGFKSYYAVAFFYKEAIALQILFVWGLVWVCRNRKPEALLTGEGMLLLAAAINFVFLSFFSRAQIGIRHILPVLAIETVIAGAPFQNFYSKSRTQKAVLAVLVLWLGISVASYFPQMIPYMNEWVGDRRLAYKILSDSNLDWGQDAAIAQEFVRKHPDVALDPDTLTTGRVLVRANRLTGVYRWDSAAYLAQYEPVAQVGYAHFLFVVPKGAVSVAPRQ